MKKSESILEQQNSSESSLDMLIPLDQVSDEAIDNLVAEYCLRDWGLNETEAPLEERKVHVKAALKRGDLVILYSQHLETAQLVDASMLENK